MIGNTLPAQLEQMFGSRLTAVLFIFSAFDPDRLKSLIGGEYPRGRRNPVLLLRQAFHDDPAAMVDWLRVYFDHDPGEALIQIARYSDSNDAAVELIAMVLSHTPLSAGIRERVIFVWHEDDTDDPQVSRDHEDDEIISVPELRPVIERAMEVAGIE